MSQRPELCEDCARGLHRAYCKTYPITCRDQVEIWEDGFAAGAAWALRLRAKIIEESASAGSAGVAEINSPDAGPGAHAADADAVLGDER